MSIKHTFALEIGTEEIPAFDLHKAFEQLKELVPSILCDARISFDEVSIRTTPRRLVVLVGAISDKTRELEEVFRGPSLKIALDQEGNYTKAALGFARSKGVSPAALLRCKEGKKEYISAVVNHPPTPVFDLLPSIIANIIEGIIWPKSCRWGTTSVYFSRPVRWLLALLDDQVVPAHFAGLDAGRITWGHRFLSNGPHEVQSAADLPAVLRDACVVLHEHERKEIICREVTLLEQQVAARAKLPEKTLLEVTNLCEQPSVLMGHFDEEFLQVPEEIVVDALLVHQRYFPLYDENQRLTNKFILVSNGNPLHSSTIVAGNERVVRARLSDAKFFYEEDLKHPLESYVERLDSVVFQERLGTMKDKTERMVVLADYLAASAGLDSVDAADAHRGAYLSKADLVTNAVVEFTSVQGVMGSYYARASHETEHVAQAIADQYHPRFSGDALPTSVVGSIVALSDKLDTIAGLFALGQEPSGSSDPFALRRSALGVIAILESGLPLVLIPAIYKALDGYQGAGITFERDAVAEKIIDFFITRTKVMLRETGCSADTIEAVLSSSVQEPVEISARARALSAARVNDPQVFEDLAVAYARAHNLADQQRGCRVDASLFSEVERNLDAAITQAQDRVEKALQADEYAHALAELAGLRLPVDLFFEGVMVMDPDERLRENRLRLLNRFVAVFAPVANFSLMAKAGR